MARLLIGIVAGYLVWTLISFPLGEVVPVMIGERHADPQTGLVSNWYIFVVQWPLTLMASVVAGLVTGLFAGRAVRTQAVQGLAMVLIAIGLFSMVLTFVAKNEGDTQSATLGEAAGLAIVEGEILGEVARSEAAGETPEVALETAVIQPIWNLLSLPLVAGLGVILGGGLLSGGPAGREHAKLRSESSDSSD
ncbi:MAG: hypothetical protein OSA40_11995 [Phycisphaerales bacterium]|nr:hypothetical protein [Phycisphaerales bacterium]